MPRRPDRPRLLRENMSQALVLAALVAVACIGLFGPTGLLAWGEHRRLLSERSAELAELSEKRDTLRNRVQLLDSRNADPDLVGELLRRNLNVAHPDELVIERR
jgi:cell division protein FtsB